MAFVRTPAESVVGFLDSPKRARGAASLRCGSAAFDDEVLRVCPWSRPAKQPHSRSRSFGFTLLRVRDRNTVEQGYVYEDARHIARHGPPFDRVGYAMRALRMLRPHGLTVAVREGRFGLTVEGGRDWARGEGARWAVISIPPDATREEIVVAVADVAGVSRSAWMLDVLMGAAQPE